MLRRLQAELLLGQRERPLGMLAGEFELPAMDRDERDGQVVLRHLEAVLDRDLVRALGVLGRAVPVARPELHPRETPERAGAARLVAVTPLATLALEQRPRLVPAKGRHENADDRERRLLHKPLAAERRREVVRRQRQLRRGAVADDPAEDRPYHPCTRAKPVVVERVREFERDARVLERMHVPLAETRRPRQPAVDLRLEAGPRGRLPQRLLQQRDSTLDALELSQQHERIGAHRAVLRLVQQLERNRARPRPLACNMLGTGRGQRAPSALVALLGRRQPERLLGELRRDRGRATAGR